ncbi:TRIM56 [Mytilus coruscus]|uniref:TRIM56 n=1 Tax=Mytilus coruscus TaxID=42192 RepID=A0A6J8BG31_MYTCO|nr:TRIM56 [Mytilus coruscus]
MADNISIAEAQMPQVCHMCEENADIKFKCLDCAFLLCPRCRKLHEKVRTKYVHQIIDLKDKRVISKDSKSNRVYPIRCEFHADENYIMCCQECQQLVCATCILTMHQKHEMGDMTIILSSKVTKLKQYQETIDTTILPNISRNYARYDDLMEFHTKRVDIAKTGILDWKNYLINTVTKLLDKQAEKFCEQIDKNIDEIKQNILPQLSELDDMKRHIKEVRSEIELVTNSHDLTQMINLEKSMESSLKKVNAQKKKERTNYFEFTQSELKIPKLGDLTLKAVFELQCTQSIETGLSCIDKMASYKHGELLVRNLELKNVCLLKTVHDKIIELQKWNIEVKDITALQTGEIIVILVDKPDLRLLPNKQHETIQVIRDCADIFFDTAPQIPTALHTTRENNVIISTVETGRDWLPMDDPCKVEIIVITAKSDIISRFIFDKDLFCFPNKITSIGTDICIADSISDYSGRLITLDNNGKVKWTYGDNETNSVIIADMVSTPLYNIVLLDSCQSVLRVLNSKGAFLNTWNLRDFNVTDAYAMTVSMDEQILIGCGQTGTNLHILEFRE